MQENGLRVRNTSSGSSIYVNGVPIMSTFPIWVRLEAGSSENGGCIIRQGNQRIASDWSIVFLFLFQIIIRVAPVLPDKVFTMNIWSIYSYTKYIESIIIDEFNI